MASGRAQRVVRDGASALHHLLQPAASPMESDLDRGEGHSQKVGDFGSGQGVGFVQQNYSAPGVACFGRNAPIERRRGHVAVLQAPFLNRPVTVLFSIIPNMVLRIKKFSSN